MASAPDLQRHRAFFTVDDVDVDDLRALVDTVTPAERYPNAEAIDREVVVYDMASERSPEQRRAVIEELSDVFGAGPGVVVMRNVVNITDNTMNLDVIKFNPLTRELVVQAYILK